MMSDLHADERWLPIPGYEGRYEVSDQGRVRGLDRVGKDGRRLKGQILRTRRIPDGYLHLFLYDEHGNKRSYGVHRLMARAFFGEPLDGQQARHLNGIRDDNRIENLAWGSRIENAADRYCHGTHRFGIMMNNAKLTSEIVIAARQRAANGESIRGMAREYGVAYAVMHNAVRGIRWAHIREGLGAVS
jgi:hypothetical protein